MKTNLNIAPAAVAAALLASTFTPSDASRLGHATKKVTAADEHELIGRKLNGPAAAPGGSASSDKPDSDTDPCYIGAKFLQEYAIDSSTRCCLLPPLYYGLLLQDDDPDVRALVPLLDALGCKNTVFPPTSPTERPDCYEYGSQTVSGSFGL